MSRKKNNRYLFASCLLCGMSKEQSIIPKSFRTPPAKWLAVEVRENRGGRGVGGFFLRDGFTLKEALESDELEVRELAVLQLNKLKTVVQAYLSAGILKPEDLTEG